MKKRLLYGVLLAGLGVNLFFGAQIYFRSAEAAEKEDVYQHFDLFTRVLERVRHDYVDGEDLTYQDLIYGALKGMLGTLDPHSEFMEPRKYEDLRKDTEGSFGGIGIVIGLREGALTVIQPMEGTPAYRAGLLPGDRIIQIDGESTADFQLEDAVKLLRGKPDSEVELTIYRPVSEEEKKVRLKRDTIKVYKVKDINGDREFPLGEDQIGYIRLLQFDEQTTHDLEQALDTLGKQGMRALVLDLRGNPGGLLDQAVEVCDLFLPRGQLIVATEGRGASDNMRYYAQHREKYPDLPIAVLVNGGSASASEIVAGCLKDLDRAVIVGEKTFGKGSVQKIIPMPDGSALRLTTSKYFTPSHSVIHEKGIEPDIEIAMSDEEEQALYLRRMPGGMENLEETLSAFDEEKRRRLRQLVQTVTDKQLDRARDLLHGIRIFTERHREAKQIAVKEE